MRNTDTLVAAGLAAAMALSVAAPATALEQGRRANDRRADRPVMICDTDASTRRAFTREHGAAPVFITAEQALRVRPADPAWDAPRCMTEREYAKLRDASAARTRVP